MVTRQEQKIMRKNNMLTTKMKKLELLTTFGIFLAVSSHVQGGYACTYDEIYNDIPQHVYFFKLYALDTVLQFPEGATKADLIKAMISHILAEATLVGHYARKHAQK